jgi:hypothetical protein
MVHCSAGFDKRTNQYKKRFNKVDDQKPRGVIRAIEGVRAISILRGGSLEIGQLDRLARSFALLLGCIASFQAISTAIISHRDRLLEVRLLYANKLPF